MSTSGVITPTSVKNSQWIQIYKNFLKNGINIARYAPGGSATGNDQPPPAAPPAPPAGTPTQPDPVVIPGPGDGTGGYPGVGGGGGGGKDDERHSKHGVPVEGTPPPQPSEGNAYQQWLQGAYGRNG